VRAHTRYPAPPFSFYRRIRAAHHGIFHLPLTRLHLRKLKPFSGERGGEGGGRDMRERERARGSEREIVEENVFAHMYFCFPVCVCVCVCATLACVDRSGGKGQATWNGSQRAFFASACVCIPCMIFFFIMPTNLVYVPLCRPTSFVLPGMLS